MRLIIFDYANVAAGLSFSLFRGKDAELFVVIVKWISSSQLSFLQSHCDSLLPLFVVESRIGSSSLDFQQALLFLLFFFTPLRNQSAFILTSNSRVLNRLNPKLHKRILHSENSLCKTLHFFGVQRGALESLAYGVAESAEYAPDDITQDARSESLISYSSMRGLKSYASHATSDVLLV